MRKSMTRVLLLALILALLCVGAMAADTLTIGQTDTQKANYTVTPLDANGKEVRLTDGKYEGVEKFSLTYSDAAGEQLVMLLLGKDDAVPTASNIYYIDQQSQNADGTCTFTIYPKQLTSGTYRLMVASKTSETAATIKYEAAYMLGDVNDDGRVTSQDASYALQIAIKSLKPSETQKLAADVNLDGRVTSQDASYILRKAIKDIKSFEEIQ